MSILGMAVIAVVAIVIIGGLFVYLASRATPVDDEQSSIFDGDGDPGWWYNREPSDGEPMPPAWDEPYTERGVDAHAGNEAAWQSGAVRADGNGGGDLTGAMDATALRLAAMEIEQRMN